MTLGPVMRLQIFLKENMNEACLRFWLSTVLTLVMSFRGFSLSGCMVVLELRLYSHPNEGKDPDFRAMVE